MNWYPTGRIAEWDRPASTGDFVEVGEDEANRVIEELRERWSQL